MRRLSFNNNLANALINKDVDTIQKLNYNQQKLNYNQGLVIIKQRKVLVLPKIKQVLKLIPRIVLIIFCIVEFCAYGGRMTISYFSYDTVVKVNYLTDEESIVPGITICFPFFSIWDQIKMKYPKFESYTKLSLDKLNQLKKQSIENPMKIWINDFKLEINGSQIGPTQLYDLFQNKSFQEISLLDIFNLSVPVDFDYNGTKIKTVDGDIIMNKKIKSNKISNEKKESIIFDHKEKCRKCFTLYRNGNIFDNQIPFEGIKVKINYNQDWFREEFASSFDYLFVVHKPNFIPMANENSYIRLKPNREYIILFSRIKKYLLKYPFKTDCFEYKEKLLNQEHCLADCLEILSKDKCGDCEPRFNLQLKNFVRSKTVKICNFSFDCGKEEWNYDEAKNDCETKCKADCYTEFYDYFVTSDKPHERNDSINTTIIRIIHKTIPDVEIRHFPEFTWNSYVANMGGLAGMWLGFSAISLYDWIMILIKKVYERFYKKNIVQPKTVKSSKVPVAITKKPFQ